MDREKEKKVLGLSIGGVNLCFDEWIDQFPTLEWGLQEDLRRVVPGYKEADNGWFYTQMLRTEMGAVTTCVEYWGA